MDGMLIEGDQIRSVSMVVGVEEERCGVILLLSHLV